MHCEPQFRIALAAILFAVFLVRVYGHLQTLRAGKLKRMESTLNITLRIMAGLAGIAALSAYLIRPEWMEWASVPLPDWLRWTGVGIATIGTTALGWVHRELGRNFAATLHVRAEGHTLVTTGPYRWVRNPMYTSIYLILFSFFLVSANWVIGLGWFTGFTVLMIARVEKEEALMEEKFGDQYRKWAARTGRFLPRIDGDKHG